MSDGTDENPPSREVLLEVLGSPDLMALHGYKITPRGAMVLTLVKKYPDMAVDEADALATDLENVLFLSGYLILHESRLGVLDNDA